MSKHDKHQEQDEPRVTATIDPSKTAQAPTTPDLTGGESLRICKLNGRQYLVPDRAIRGDELLKHLTFLAGAEALRGTLLVLTRDLDGGTTVTQVTPSSVIGSTFAAPGTLQIAPPLTFYTLRTDG